MIPIKEFLPLRRPPVVTWALIAANLGFYLYYFGFNFSPTDAQFAQVVQYMVVPAQIAQGRHLETLVTAQFLHASLLHLGGNMLFLHVFGNNVEDAIGRLRYLLFYLACGVVGGLAQSYVDPTSSIPSLGASGAIAGVLAAFVVMYPRAQIETLVLFGFIPLFFKLSAVFFIGVWIFLQFISGFAQLGVSTQIAQGGVGYFAHIGGFVSGLLLLYAIRPRRHEIWQ